MVRMSNEKGEYVGEVWCDSDGCVGEEKQRKTEVDLMASI